MFISALTTLNLGMTEERSKRASLLPVNITLDHEGEASFYHSLFHVLYAFQLHLYFANLFGLD